MTDDDHSKTLFPKRFTSESVVFWKDRKTDLTLVSDASTAIAELRVILRREAIASKRLEMTLLCVHWCDSFEGITGTMIHGSCWRLHRPFKSTALGFWECLDYAWEGDWIEVKGLPLESQ